MKKERARTMKNMEEATINQLRMQKEQITEAGELFTDQDFPPDFSSLYNPEIDYERSQPDAFRKLEWKRASEIFTDPTMFNDISPDDINQGCLGNCYFLAVLSAMAEFPERIEAMFETKEVNA